MQEGKASSPVEVVRVSPVTVLVAAFPEQVLRRASDKVSYLFVYVDVNDGF